MRVDGAVTYDVSQGHDVDYVGMTADGSKVYFTSAEQLTGEDHDASIDLYMWSEEGEAEGDPLTLVSKGDNPGNAGEPGNSDACKQLRRLRQASQELRRRHLLRACPTASSTGGAGGNCRSDNSIASENGDIYFFSPEQLDGSRGIPNQENLYDYRNGQVQFVTTLDPEHFCYRQPGSRYQRQCLQRRRRSRGCRSPRTAATWRSSPPARSPSTTTPATWRCTPTIPRPGRIICVSCIPSGEPPTSDVDGSQDGLFMTNDGRAFFTTEDALVHADTNNAQDVYEYVDGRAQLITTGHRRDQRRRAASSRRSRSRPGWSGSAPTAPTSTSRPSTRWSRQDHNGLFLKFYDARAGGGFSSAGPAAAVRSRRRVPRRRQLAAGRRSRTEPVPRSAGGNAVRRRSEQPTSGKKQHKRRQQAAARRHRRHGGQRDEAARESRARGAGRPSLAGGRRRARARRRAGAGPNTPITSFSAMPSSTPGRRAPRRRGQLRGRKPRPPAQPERLQLRGRERRDRPPAGRASSATRTRRRSARSPSSPPMTARSTRRSASSTCSRPTGSPSTPPSTTSSRRPTTPGCSASRSSSSTRRSSRSSAPAPAATTGSTRRRPRSTTALFPLETLPAGPLGGAGRPEPRPPAARPGDNSHGGEPSYLGDALRRERSRQHHRPEHGRQTLHRETSGSAAASNSPLTPFLQNPTTCDSARSTRSLDVLSYDGGTDQRRRPLAADDRLRPAQLQPEPLRAADDDRDRLAPRGSTSTSTVPQQLSPTIPSPTELRGATVTLPPGLLDQPQRRRRQDRLLGRRSELRHRPKQPTARSSPRSAASTIDSSALPGPLPGFVYLGRAAARQPLPDLPRRRRLRHPRQARRARSPRTRRPAS